MDQKRFESDVDSYLKSLIRSIDKAANLKIRNILSHDRRNQIFRNKDYSQLQNKYASFSDFSIRILVIATLECLGNLDLLISIQINWNISRDQDVDC